MISRILLEIGHGPGNGPRGIYDPGATSGPYSEHGILSGVVNGIAAAFRTSLTEVTLVPDTLPLRDTISWINGTADASTALLSFHLNSASSSKARGTEVIVAANAPDIRQMEALRLARAVSAALRIPMRDKPVLLDSETPRGRIAIVRDTNCPAYLIEMGFISNQQDRLAVLSRGITAGAAAVRALTGDIL